ncbi:hypothetical protein ACFXOD_27140 [Streptomyces sp. NPDC059161]|uniref:hypothetical protein n=1 Tax=Streptomyces sp. NPDC059161 TaxID=3346749 RepID=UPI00369FB7A8
MSSGVIIILVGAAVIVVAAVVLGTFLTHRDGGLRRRFGPEYERTVAQHNGDTKAAEKELDERVRRHGGIRTRPPTAEEQGRYTAEWTRIQEEFVDSPPRAVADAEALLGRLARERGFPDRDSEEHLAALSVHHPHHMDSYRRIRGVAQGSHERAPDTEELRETLVRAHDFFAALIGERRQRDAGRVKGRTGRHASRAGLRRGVVKGSAS